MTHPRCILHEWFESEGRDRRSMALPGAQPELLADAVEAAPYPGAEDFYKHVYAPGPGGAA